MRRRPCRTRETGRDALNVLRGYAWPGNIRQLHHAIERAALLANGERIDLGDLPDYVFAAAPDQAKPREFVESLPDLALRE